MAINFNLNDLQAFRAVAELNSFRKAADALHVSQPAFSRRIEKLEEALGVRLLERTTRRVSLTSVGREFDRKVQQLLDDLDQTLLGIRGADGPQAMRTSPRRVPATRQTRTWPIDTRYHPTRPAPESFSDATLARISSETHSSSSVLKPHARITRSFGFPVLPTSNNYGGPAFRLALRSTFAPSPILSVFVVFSPAIIVASGPPNIPDW